MPAASPPAPLAEQIAAALAWWREAGVEHAYDDTPAPWLSPSRPAAEEAAREREELRAAPSQAGEAAVAPSANALPGDLAAFTAWWMNEPMLDEGRIAARVAPRGPREPALMVLVPEPEPDDDERLLAGREGRLLAAMLAAAGVDEHAVYVASVLPRHTPAPDWQALAARGFGRILAHHVTLVRPARLVAFGTHILPLLGHDPPLSSASAAVFAHDGTSTPLLGARSLSALIEMPVWKAAWWRAWLDWTR